MEGRTKIDEAGRDGSANAPESDGDDERARLIGSIIADWIATLGEDVAYVDGGVVRIVPAAGEDIQRRGRSGATDVMHRRDHTRSGSSNTRTRHGSL